MGFIESIKNGLNNFFNPYGRATRGQFWWYWLFMLIIAGVLGVIGGFVSGHGGVEQTWVGIVFDVFSAIALASLLCAEIRRLHDIGRSGWNLCWSFIPFFGGLYVLYLLIKPSEAGPNRYGEPIDYN